MARVVALVQSTRTAHRLSRPREQELLRTAIVCGCALALILARAPLPF